MVIYLKLTKIMLENRRPDIGFIPTEPEIIKAAFALANVTASDVIYDLGCGDGRVAISAALEFGVQAVGIDIDPQRIKEAKNNALQAGVSNLVDFRLEDLFSCDFAEATVVFLYLLPHLNLRLKPQLLRQLKPGSRIVSRDFDMGDWLAEKFVVIETPEEECTLYLWYIPEVLSPEN
jgi:SAM-dependent methyltransferase